MKNKLNKEEQLLQSATTVELTDTELSNISGGGFLGDLFGIGDSLFNGGKSKNGTSGPSGYTSTSDRKTDFSNSVGANIGPLSAYSDLTADGRSAAMGGTVNGNVTGIAKGGDISATISPISVSTKDSGSGTATTGYSPWTALLSGSNG